MKNIPNQFFVFALREVDNLHYRGLLDKQHEISHACDAEPQLFVVLLNLSFQIHPRLVTEFYKHIDHLQRIASSITVGARTHEKNFKVEILYPTRKYAEGTNKMDTRRWLVHHLL